ncbi:uncharacterized protein LOC117268308 [Epinephelus lanceolatus]
MEYAWDEDIFLDLSVEEFQFSDRGEDYVRDPSRIKISKTINSCPVQPSQECCARGYNDSGRKLSMYYGTTRENAQSILANGFRQSADGMLGRGIYLSTELKKAKRYPIGHPESDKVVIQVKVNVGKVISIKYQGHPRQKNWHDSRYGLVYDTAWVPPRCGILKSGSEDSCVWDPSRIQIIKIIDPRPVQPSDEGGAWTCAFLCIIIFLWIFFIFRLMANQFDIMYHGTTRANARSILANGFRQSEDGMFGRGVYLYRDQEDARRFPVGHLNLGNVIIIGHQHHPRQKTWHDPRYGPVYDTASVPGGSEVCVWDPSKITIYLPLLPPCLALTGKHDTDTNMMYAWAEDDFDVPDGVGRLGLSEPINNRKYIMYHGTTKRNAELILASGCFHQSADGMLGPGVYLSRDLEKASRYPIDHPEYDRIVIKVVVNVGKVIAINYQGHPCQKTWHNFGYDTAWVPPKCGMVKSGLEEDCVWDPSRIKILKTIRPRPTQPSGGCGAWGYM